MANIDGLTRLRTLPIQVSETDSFLRSIAVEAECRCSPYRNRFLYEGSSPVDILL